MTIVEKHSKFFLLLGGFIGFAVVFFAGLLVTNRIDAVLRDATIGCLVGALLMRLFLHVVTNAMQDVAARKKAEREAQEEAEEAAENETSTEVGQKAQA